MIFNSIDIAVGDVLDRLGLFKKSFADIWRDLSRGIGIFDSIFSDVVDDSVIVKITDYVNAVRNGCTDTEYLKTIMEGTGVAAKGCADDILLGKMSLDDLSVATLKSRSAMNSFKKILSGIGASLLNAISMAAIIAAIKGALWVFDQLVVTAEESAQAVNDTFNEYEDAKQKVVDINSELKTTQERIDELLRKKSLSFVEQAELDKLKQVTDELRLQNLYAEKEEQRAAKKAAETAAQAFHDTYIDAPWFGKDYQAVNAENVDAYYEDAKYSGFTGYIGGEDLVAGAAEYKLALDKKNEAYEKVVSILNKDRAEWTEQDQILWDNYQDASDYVGELEGELSSHVEILRGYQKSLQASPDVSPEFLAQIETTIDYLTKLMYPAEYNQMKIEDIFDDKQLAKYKDELIEIAKAQNGIKLDDLRGYGELIAAVAKNGFTEDDLIRYINAESDELDFVTAEEQMYQKLAEQMKAASEKEPIEVDVNAEPKATEDTFTQWYENLSEDQQPIVLRWILDDDLDASQFSISELQKKLDAQVADNKLSLADLVFDNPDDDGDFASRINAQIEKYNELIEYRDKLRNEDLAPEERAQIEFELKTKYTDIATAADVMSGLDAEIQKTSGTMDQTTQVWSGAIGILMEMSSVVKEEDRPAFLSFCETVLQSMSASEQAAKGFTSLKDALEGVSDGASLYKKAQEEMEAESLSPDTAASIVEALGGGEDAWKHFAVTANGELQLTESGFEQLKQTVFANLDAMTNAPDGFIDAMKNVFGVIITGAEEATDPLEKLSNAISNVGKVSSYLTDIESGDVNFIDALEDAVGFIEEMNKGLPEGAEKYTLDDFFSFDESGNIEYKTDALTNWVNDWVDKLDVSDELKAKMKEAAKAATEQTDALEPLTSAMDKVTSASSLLSQAQEEMAESGKVSVDTIKSLYDMFGTEAANLIKFGIDGSPSIDQEAIKEKIYGDIDKAFGAGTEMSQILKLELDVQMEQEALDDTVDNYMSSVQTLQEAFDQLLSGEFEDSDLAELLREFPELRGHTDDLASGIKELIAEMDTRAANAFQKAIDALDPTAPDFESAKKELEAYQNAVLAVGASIKELDTPIRMSVEVENFDAVQNALSESNSETGLSAESIKLLKDRYVDLFDTLEDEGHLFVRMADGVRINEKAFKKLEKEYQKQIKSDLDKKLIDLQDKYNRLDKEMRECADTARRENFYAQQQDILEQIYDVELLRAQYDALTSAYNRWIEAQSNTNPRDRYTNVGEGYEGMKELVDAGWYGDDSLQAYLDLIWGEQERSAAETITAFKKITEKNPAGKTLLDYWKTNKDGNLDTNGLIDFVEDVGKVLGSDVAGQNGSGYYINFTEENIDKISEAFGYSTEMIGIFMSALSDTGANIVYFDELADKIVGVGKASKGTQNSIKQMAQESGASIEGIPEYNIEALTNVDKINEATEAWEKYKESTPELTEETKSAIDAEIDRLGRQKATIQIETALKDGHTVEELLGMSDEELATEVGIDLNSETFDQQIEAVRAKLQTLSDNPVEIPITVKLEENQFNELLGKNKENKEQTETVTVETEGQEDVEELDKSVDAIKSKTETLTVETKDVDKLEYLKGLWDSISDKTATLTANIKTNSSSSPSPNPTVKAEVLPAATGTAYARGDWGLNNSGVALGGELGQELIVRDGRFFTIGDQSAEFFKYRKGDIIFNHQQTEEIFKYGRILNSQKRGFAFAGGTATGIIRPSEITSSSGSGSSSSGSSSAKSAKEDFEEVFDWIEIAIDRIEREIDNLDLKATSVYRTWEERTKNIKEEMSAVRSEIELQTNAYERYMQAANDVGLDESWAKLVREGAIDISTITDEELAEKISEYQEWYEKALDVKYAVDELTESLSDLYKEAFDNVVAQYEGILNIIEQEKNLLDEYVSQIEAKGYLVSAKYYQAMIEAEQSNIRELKKEKEALIDALNTAVKDGAIAEESEAWYEMQAEINDVTIAIEEANTAIIEYNNSIRDLEWEVFDLMQERIEHIAEEAEFLIDLMSNEKLYDEKGQLTDEGNATLGLHGMNYNTYMQQADRYAKEMAKINEELANDPNNQNLIDRKQELLELQQESILAAEGEKEAIKDMVEEGIKLELDALKELIDSYKDALDSQKDLYDYQKKVKNQTKEIVSLEKQLAAYAGDNSEEAKAKIQQLKVSLEEAQQDLEETEYDKYISDQETLLDDLYEEYETVLNKRLDDMDALIEDMIFHINSNSDSINNTITSAADKVGYQLTDTLNTIWSVDNGKNVIVMYGNDTIDATTSLTDAIYQLDESMQQMLETFNQQAKIDTTDGVEQIRGYEWNFGNDSNDESDEVIIRPSDGAVLRPIRRKQRNFYDYGYIDQMNMSNDMSEYVRKNLNLKDTDATPDITHSIGRIDNRFDITIDLPNVTNYEQFRESMRTDKNFERMVRSMTVDQMFGESSLKKYKH